MTLLVEASPGLDETLRPWLEAHAALRGVDVVRALPDRIPAGVEAVVRVGDQRLSPARALRGPVLPTSDVRGWVPAGWVPADEGLPAFVAAAASAVRRADEAPVAILGQRSQRYARLAERLESNLKPDQTVRWTAERITREDLLAALGCGLGLAVYLGHGRPNGWAAYRGLRSTHLLEPEHRGSGRPLGALVSVTCWTASRWRTRRSFTEQAVGSGRAAAAVGSIRPVEHLASTRLVLALAGALQSNPPTTIGALMVRIALPVVPMRPHLTPPAGGQARLVPRPEAGTLRLVGDPCAPLAAAAGAAAHARSVFAPALDHVPVTQDRPVTPSRATVGGVGVAR